MGRRRDKRRWDTKEKDRRDSRNYVKERDTTWIRWGKKVGDKEEETE
jgi:hypothetical protein